MRRIALVALVTASMVVMGAGAAFAGEVTGNGKSLKDEGGSLNGHSICSFSGLNDEYYIGGDTTANRTQSWGQVDKDTRAFLTSIGFHPGDACNPTQAAAPPH